MINDQQVVPLGDMLNSAIAPLKKALEQGEALEKSLHDQWQAQKTENAKARRALEVLDPSVAPKPKKKLGKGRTGHLISTERAQAVLDAIRALDFEGKAITQPDARTVSGLPQTAVSKGFRYLRSIEVIGRAGVDPETGRDRYRILNDDFTVVPENLTDEAKPKKAPKTKARRVPHSERVDMLRKYIADYGTDGVYVRKINGVTGFTVGALMNALTKADYGNTTWDRSKGHGYVKPLLEDGTLVDLGKQEDGYGYLSIANPTPSWVKEATWANN